MQKCFLDASESNLGWLFSYPRIFGMQKRQPGIEPPTFRSVDLLEILSYSHPAHKSVTQLHLGEVCVISGFMYDHFGCSGCCWIATLHSAYYMYVEYIFHDPFCFGCFVHHSLTFLDWNNRWHLFKSTTFILCGLLLYFSNTTEQKRTLFSVSILPWLFSCQTFSASLVTFQNNPRTPRC